MDSLHTYETEELLDLLKMHEGIVIVEHLADKKNGNFPSELVETKAKLERY